MHPVVLRFAKFSSTFIILAILAACTMSLVPQYQKSLVDGINAANVKATTLFASLALGSPQSQFGPLKPRYDEVIGTFDALRVEAQSRPVSDLTARLLGSGRLKDICQDAAVDANVCANSTPFFLAKIVDLLTRVEKKHQRSGVDPDLVVYYKEAYDRQIVFAMTVENALKR